MTYPPEWQSVIDALSGPSMLWLVDVQNHTKAALKPRQAMYDQLPGIRRKGVYIVRDLEGPPGLFYVGMVRKDPFDGCASNPKADGIIGRLSTHRNMHGAESKVLRRWWDYTHPHDPLPAKITTDLRLRVWSAAKGRIGASFCPWLPGGEGEIEAFLIRQGVPGSDAPPLLNDQNWSRRPNRG
jgi:hypothetical protein